MNTKNTERMCGAVDQEAFEQVICENLSPEAVAMIIAFLQSASCQPTNEDAMNALRQVEWLTDTLIDLLGVEQHNRLIDKLGL